MKQILRFEFQKIFIRKVNQIAITAGLLLVMISNIALINGESLYLDGEDSLEGINAIKTQTETENALSTELSEEFLTGFLLEYQQEIQENPFGYDFSLIDPKSNLFALIADNYVEWNDNWDWETLNQISTQNGISFYERRIKKIETLLNADYTYGNYTNTEKDYWLQKAESIHTPFVWGSRTIWTIILRSVNTLFFQCFVIAICLAPVFAGEFQNHTDSLLLSTRHGKSKLIYAKMIASFTFTFFYFSLCSILTVGIDVIILGIDGWNLPIQLWSTIIPYHLNALEACGLSLLVLFLSSFLLTAITLMFSTVCKSQMVTLVFDVLLLFGTVFIPFSKTSGLWNHILYLCPIYTLDLINVLKSFISYQFGNVVIPHLMMIFIAYVIITVVCLGYAKKNFRKHQIGK